MQVAAEAQANVPVAEAPVPAVSSAVEAPSVPMEIDQPQPDRGTKRHAEEEPAEEAHKKARTGMFTLWFSFYSKFMIFFIRG